VARTGRLRRRIGVVLIDNGQPLRGGALSTFAMLKHLPMDDVDVFVNVDASVARHAREIGLKPHVVGGPVRRRDGRYLPQLPRIAAFSVRLARLLRYHRIGLLHCDYEHLGWVIPSIALGRFRLTCYVRGTISVPRTRMLKAKFSLVSVIFAISDAVKSQISAHTSTPVVVVRNGVDVERWLPIRERRAQRHARGERPRVLLVGALSGEKRVAEFLTYVAARLPTHDFDVVGHEADASYARECAMAAQRAGGSVRFWGHRDDVERFMSDTTVLALPSKVEGSPRVAIEAQLAGVPVVAMRFAGVEEAVYPALGGTITDDWRDMARAIEMINADRDPPQNGHALASLVDRYDEATNAARVLVTWNRLRTHPKA
jgi:glycosyltransferase involved in cell wall biosynthesis